jgi:hypothetical protein
MGLLNKAQAKKKAYGVGQSLGKTVNISTNKSSYHTPLDKLYYLVQTNGAINVNDAAKNLDLSVGDIEKYARILKQNDQVDFFYPAIGPLQLRKKGFVPEKKKREPIQIGNFLNVFNERKVFLILLIIILLGSGIGYSLLVEEKIEIKVEKTSVPVVNTISVEDAFSGGGDYVCLLEKDSVSANYKIKNKNLYIESISDNVNTTVIIKDGFTYTKLGEKWAKIKTLKETIIPGSGKYPAGEGLSIECNKQKIENKLFEIEEVSII